MTEDEFQAKLTPEQYAVLRQKGTEPPFSGKTLNTTDNGDYVCAACGATLFKSDSKYKSNISSLAGWPSFAEVATSDAVVLTEDDSHGMHRTEVTCRNCGSHLGHLFPDDSSPSGKHYCVNDVALNFEPKP